MILVPLRNKQPLIRGIEFNSARIVQAECRGPGGIGCKTGLADDVHGVFTVRNRRGAEDQNSMVQPERKRNRFSTWEYRRIGPYFVTLCAHRRRPIFAPEFAKLKVVEAVRETARRYGATVHAVCVAQDHVHALLSLAEHSPVTLSQVIGAARVRVTQMLRATKVALRTGRQADPYAERQAMIVAGNVPIAGRVGASLLARPMQRVWQRSFYDHIIRNDADFQEKARYIENHPIKEPGTVFAEWH